MKKAKAIALLGVLTFPLALAACGDDTTEADNETSEESEASTETADNETEAAESEKNESAEPSAQTAPVTFDGETLELAPTLGETDDPEVGKVFPTIAGTDFEGNELTIEADGKPKAIVYLAHWCGHCQAEVPVIQDLINNGDKPENLDIYSISTLVEESPVNYPPSKWLEEESWTPPVILDDENSTLFTESGGQGTPYVIYLDGENKITKRTSGQLGKSAILADWQEAAE